MTQEQTAYAGGDIEVLINVIDPSGSHVAAVVDTSTTRLDGFAAAPTVTTVATGIYRISFSSVTPAPAEGDRLVCKVNGTIASVAWSEYGIPVKIVADERGTDDASPSRLHAFPDASGTDLAESYQDITNNLPVVSKAIVRFKLSGNVSSASDWIIRLYSPGSGSADLTTGLSIPAYASNYILQTQVDISAADTPDGQWTIGAEDINTAGSVISISDATVEFSDIPAEIGDATLANQTSISSAISALNDFDPTSQTVIVGTNNDKTGYSISGTKQTLDALNDIAATSIVTGGAITTSAGSVSNVTLVATTTTNTDMRGTNGANTVAPDNVGITANGTAISGLNNISAADVFNELTATSWASGSFGERLIVSQGTHRTVQVTGSNHVAADVHEFQNDTITAAAIAADAVTEIQTGLVVVGTQFTYTNQAGDTHDVTIT